jgi:hypothetical protein
MYGLSTCEILLDEARGIYIPQAFYENFDFSIWNLKIEDYSELRDPDLDGYWEAWDELLRNAEYHDDNGYVWRLRQDGSLFALRNDHNYEEE